MYGLLHDIVASARLRALAAFIAAQSALLYGYGLWSGIKEITSAALIALFAAHLATLVKMPRETAPPARDRDRAPACVASRRKWRRFRWEGLRGWRQGWRRVP